MVASLTQLQVTALNSIKRGFVSSNNVIFHVITIICGYHNHLWLHYGGQWKYLPAIPVNLELIPLGDVMRQQMME